MGYSFRLFSGAVLTATVTTVSLTPILHISVLFAPGIHVISTLEILNVSSLSLAFALIIIIFIPLFSPLCS